MENYKTHGWMVETPPHGLDEVAQRNITESLQSSTIEQLLEIKWSIEHQNAETYERFEKWGGFGQPGFYTAARGMIDSEIERRVAAGELTHEELEEVLAGGLAAIIKKRFEKIWQKVKKEKLV